MTMLRTAEIDMADSVKPSDIDVFLSDAAWAIRSTYHTVLKASPGAAIFGRDMLFDIPFLADWNKTGSRDPDQMAYLTDEIAKLKKRLNKSKRHSKKRARDSSDSDLDSGHKKYTVVPGIGTQQISVLN